jgi:hypothetical protein
MARRQTRGQEPAASRRAVTSSMRPIPQLPAPSARPCRPTGCPLLPRMAGKWRKAAVAPFDRFLAQTACSWDRPQRGAHGRFHPFATPSGNGSYLRSADGRSRRIADVADRGSGRLRWAESGPRPDGRNGRDCGRTSRGAPPVRPKRKLGAVQTYFVREQSTVPRTLTAAANNYATRPPGRRRTASTQGALENEDACGRRREGDEKDRGSRAAKGKDDRHRSRSSTLTAYLIHEPAHIGDMARRLGSYSTFPELD